MPQFNFANYSSQIFWLLVSFGIFFTYVKFFFLPKLDSILSKRNDDIKKTKEEIENNNRGAKANFAQVTANVAQSNALASKIIEDAHAKAAFDEAAAIKEVEALQKKAIDEVLQNQESLTGEALNAVIVETAEVILKKIGMPAEKSEIAKHL